MPCSRRESLLGRPLTDQPASLRSRLAAAAAAQGGISGSELEGRRRWHGRGRVCSQPGAVFRHTCDSARPTCYGAFGRVSPDARCSCGAAPELLESASVAGEPVLHIPRQNGSPECVSITGPDVATVAARRHLSPREEAWEGSACGQGGIRPEPFRDAVCNASRSLAIHEPIRADEVGRP
jgi:hypothetical protein